MVYSTIFKYIDKLII